MLNAKWIKRKNEEEYSSSYFLKEFTVKKEALCAKLFVTARGVYEAKLNGKRVGDFILAPGWTSYENRIQVQEYDVTDMIEKDNRLQLQTATGWYLGRISTAKDSWNNKTPKEIMDKREKGVIAQLIINYCDGTYESISTDDSWKTADSELKFCELYDGEIFDATVTADFSENAVLSDNQDKSVLIPQQGEKIIEQERLKPIGLIKTPKGEIVLDFGQNLTGYLEITLTANKNEKASFSFAEILDKDGNFYNENYRSAKAEYIYICRDGEQTHKPNLTFYGFRYVRIDEYPTEKIDPQNFTAIVVHSDIKRTGYIRTSDKMLNQLFSNIIWGQKDNYLDIPTDCPQRDERMGWTGDAQVFSKVASYNFDVNKFFRKWLADMRLDQNTDGSVPPVIPNVWNQNFCAGWSDAVAICTYQMYLTYADKGILKEMFPAIKKWVNFVTATTTTEYLWTGMWQYGDWLELDGEYGELKGNTRDDIVSTAFYANSVNILCKIGELLGEDVEEYRELHKNIVAKFKETFNDDFKTQTEYIMALQFDLTDKKEQLVNELADLIIKKGKKIQTGFLGTPYILHILSENGYSELAYDLLLRREYPSWLYPISKGATTMWEHWDGTKPDGSLWPVGMNSYNHYAYGAVGDWLYEVSAGIRVDENNPAFERIILKPTATDKIDWLEVELNTKYGKITSKWFHKDGKIHYEFALPSPTELHLNGKTINLEPGFYEF